MSPRVVKMESTANVAWSAKARERTLAAVVFDFLDPFREHGDMIFFDPAGVLFVPGRCLAVRGDNHTGGIEQHSQRIFHRVIVSANDRDPVPLNPVSITILAKEHALSKAVIHAWNLGRQMIQTGREQQP